MADPVFSARFTPNSSTPIGGGLYDVTASIFEGTGTFSGLDIQVNDIVYLDCFPSISNPNSICKFRVTIINTPHVSTPSVRLLFDDTGVEVDPGEVTGNPGFICRPSAVNSLAFHAAPSLHTFPDYVVQYARNIESINVVDPALGGGGNGDWVTETHTVTAGEATAKQFNLTQTPLVPGEVVVLVSGSGGAQKIGVDFNLSGNTFSWTGLGLDGLLLEDDLVCMFFFK